MVRPGFKQTEVGEIPEDWEAKPLSSVCSMKSGEGITNARIKDGDKFPCYGGNGLRGYTNRFTHEGSYALIGRQGALCGNVNGVTGQFFASEHAIVVTSSPNTNIDWLTYVLGRMNLNQYSESSAQPGLSVTKLLPLNIAVPIHKDEQKTIAKALSDVDELIVSLEKLIAKKRDIKTATMQQLLTGKKRLPGFGEGKGTKQTELGEIPEDWGLLELNSISTMHGRIGWQGLKQEEFTFNDSQPFLITGMNFKDGKIRWNEVYHIPDYRYELDRNIQLRDGDVLMTKDGTIGKILYVENIPYPHKASLNSHLLVFRPKEKRYFPKYLYYLLKSKFFLDFVDFNKSGSTFFGITQEAIGKFSVLLPLFEEQKAIAKVLADIDDDIETLILCLSKTKAIKQGMMQELLTGRTRLVNVAESKKTKAA